MIGWPCILVSDRQLFTLELYVITEPIIRLLGIINLHDSVEKQSLPIDRHYPGLRPLSGRISKRKTAGLQNCTTARPAHDRECIFSTRGVTDPVHSWLSEDDIRGSTQGRAEPKHVCRSRADESAEVRLIYKD